MKIFKSYWLDDHTFYCNFGDRIGNDGEWFELVGEYREDKDSFIFERQYEDQVLPVKSLVTKLMMKEAMVAQMKKCA